MASRGAVLDWYVMGDESAVFVGDQVIALSPIATAILEALGTSSVSSEDVTAALVERFGVPGEGNPVAASERLLRELAAHGIVQIDEDSPSL